MITKLPDPGTLCLLAPGLAMVLAPNPSPMTGPGTNSFLLGEQDLCIIDPGPDDPAHLDALLHAIGGRKLSRILVTHAHLDHSPAAGPLAQATGAQVLAFGDAMAGRSARMEALLAQGLELGGGEGVDHAFRPDICLGDGAELDIDGDPAIALHTPGHMGNHLCFDWRGWLFTGDMVMGWAPSLVSPPDGDLTDFMASLGRLSARFASLGDRVLLPAHGLPVTDGAARVAELTAHRRAREAAVVAALKSGSRDLPDLVARVYADTPVALHPAAARNLLAHLVDLQARGVLDLAIEQGRDVRVTTLNTGP